MTALGTLMPPATVTQALRPILPPDVALAVSDPTLECGADHPSDLDPVGRMRPERRREFLAGRRALREAIRATGLPCGALPILPDRAPDLPAGVTASLSHSDTLCLAVAARSTRWAALGLDAEPARPLDPALIPTVLTRSERARMVRDPAPQVTALRTFCAKEAAYKCQYTLSGSLLDFDAFDVTFPGPHRFTATFRRPVAPFALGDSLSGSVTQIAGHIICLARIPE